MPSGGNSTGGNNSLLHLDSGSFIAVNLTASADSDTALAFDQINSLGMGLIANATLWFNGQTVPLWFNGQALPLAAVLPSTDLNNDGTANFTALLPAANLSVNTTAFLTNLAQNSTLVAGYAYDPDTGNIESFLLVPMTNPFIDPATKIPVVVPVNSAFNKQAVAENGYAIPDNADENLTCVSGPNEGELMVNYPGTFPKFIPGFFGIVPGTMPASFFDGANVTIVKLAVNDTETGQEEAGQVRFHVTYDLGLEDEAQYHIPISGNDVTGNSTVNNLVPALYAASPTIPNGPGVQYWVEGVTPGPITLQYTYTKGNITISQKQQFLVCTQQSKADWQAEIAQAILLETGSVNMTSYYPDYLTSGGTFLFEPNMSTSPFWNNYQFIQAVYGYYGELYNKSNGLFLWTGLAHMGAGPVYGGLVDSQYLETAPLGNVTDFGFLGSFLTSSNLTAGTNYVQDSLIYAHYSIYDDLTWQFEAYQSSGIWALRYTNQYGLDVESSSDRSIKIEYWNEMYHGDWSSNPSLVQNANFWMIYREQGLMAQRGWQRLVSPVPAYTWIETIPTYSATKVLSDLAQSPLPSGPSFRTVEGSTADIASFPVRFDWMVETTRYTSIWNQWLGLSSASRTGEASTSVYDQSKNYSLYWYYLGYPILGY